MKDKKGEIKYVSIDGTLYEPVIKWVIVRIEKVIDYGNDYSVRKWTDQHTVKSYDSLKEATDYVNDLKDDSFKILYNGIYNSAYIPEYYIFRIMEYIETVYNPDNANHKRAIWTKEKYIQEIKKEIKSSEKR